jgi:hypothetical protein
LGFGCYDKGSKVKQSDYLQLKGIEMAMQLMRLTGFFCRALAFIGTLALATASSQASVDLSTGLDASDTLINVGNTPDGHWTVDQPLGGIAAAKVVAPGDVDWPGAWLANGPSSAWITIDPTTSQNAPVIPYTYYRTFNLAASDLATASISGFWGIDDGGELKLNGTTISTSPGDYNVTTPFIVPAGGGPFTVGLNTLTITMTTSDNVWEAVRLEGALTTIPEPSTLALFGIGAISLLAYAWRKRKPA